MKSGGFGGGYAQPMLAGLSAHVRSTAHVFELLRIKICYHRHNYEVFCLAGCCEQQVGG